MSQSRDGQVVTFYSYKGGTGRTMALANVAWILAANGKRVLVVDWDLESPGLHRFFAPFMEPSALMVHGGIIDLIRAYEQATADTGYRDDNWYEAFARVHRHSFSLNWTGFPGDGALDFLSAGRHHPEYATLLAGMNWDRFYDRQGGELFFKALRADMKHLYDYTLIDSRTGLSDVADICTIEMPDTLVDCFTLSEQGIDGAATVAETIRRKYASRNIRILPVPMRVDPAEQDRAEEGRLVAKQRFAGLPADLGEAEREQYWKSILVPYRAFYAYEETLATFGDQPGRRDSLLEAYVALTKEITLGAVTGMPAMDEETRISVAGRFRRRLRVSESEVVLRYGPRAQVWAEWTQHVLASAGVQVYDPVLAGQSAADVPASATDLLILTGDEAPPDELLPPGRKNPLVIYVTDTRPWTGIQASRSASIAGLSEKDAVDRVVKLVDGANATLNGGAGPRYPGVEPVVFNAPLRNPRFTGREDDLRGLRAQLRGGGGTVVISGAQPVALHGMGGIGKTQVATEYVYRFRSAYDVVWWITAEQISFIDASLGDLGARLGIQAQPTSMENALAVVHALSIGEPYGRWLIVFDNVEELRGVETFLPRGRGHVLITSRNALWADDVKQVKVDVFEREESLAYLRVRVPNIPEEEAERIANVLGDLPIALATAGAWIAETGTPINPYVTELERQGPSGLALDAVWKLSLEELQRRSPGAYRLLQLCSLLDPEIALEMVYSDAMAAMLAPTDPQVSDRIMRGALVRQVNRLGLLRIDHRQEVGEGVDSNAGGQIFVHRLLQHVIQDRMTPAERDDLRHQVHLVLTALRPDGEVDDPKTWPRLRMLWPHVEVSNAVGCQDEAVRSLIIDRVRYLWLRGDLPRGLDRAEAADAAWTSAREETTSPAEQEVLRRQLLHLRFHRANILRDLGRFREAHESDGAVLDEQVALLGENHPHTLMTAGGLAGDLRGLGRYPEALGRDRATSAAWLELFGEDHPRTLTARSNLAVSYRLNGDYRSAMDIDSQVYNKRRVVLGDQHPNTLISGGAFGRDLREAGEYARSVALLGEVYDATVRALGTGSRAALDAKANLAVSLRSAGESEAAAELLDEAFDRLLTTFGLDSPHTLACLLSRAVNLLALEHPDAGYELDRVRRIYDDNLGRQHPHTLVCVNNLAMVARAGEDRSQARSQALEAAVGMRDVLGEGHPYTLAAETNVAICTAEAGDVEEGLELMIPLARRSIDILGADHPDALRSLANEALMRRMLGQAEAELSLNRLRGTLAARLGGAHPAVDAINRARLLHRVIDPHPF
jgi:MinD-like ATPase involved in chromosome partitioning or flagellar assembly/tetratricopeptide (TPR) repeat protein